MAQHRGADQCILVSLQPSICELLLPVRFSEIAVWCECLSQWKIAHRPYLYLSQMFLLEGALLYSKGHISEDGS